MHAVLMLILGTGRVSDSSRKITSNLTVIEKELHNDM
jgi:hypothetical protein